MKKIRILYSLFLGLPFLSFTNKAVDSFFTLTAFEIEIDEGSNKAKLLTRYSSTIDTSGYSCEFSWYVEKDGTKQYLDHINMLKFKKVTNAYLSVQPEIDISTLGTDNYFILYTDPSDGPRLETKIHFNNKGKTQVTFTEDDNNVGVSSGYQIENWYLDESNYSISKEDRVTFLNYEDLVVEDYYLNFDIKRFNYLYTGNENKNILEGKFYFCIYDKYNLFPDLPLYKDSQYRYIELKPNILNGSSNFSFKENIYYDPLTHNPSISYKDGYKETDKLYFPSGKLELLKSIHCLLSFDIEGYTNFNMSSEFDICFLKNYFGDCSESEYCIEMNNDDGSNIREKVVEVNL